MKAVLSYQEWPEGSGSGTFIVEWAESVPDSTISANQDGTPFRTVQSVIRNWEEEHRYSSPQERSELVARLNQHGADIPT